MKNQITSNKVTFQTTSSSKIECIKDDLTAQWFVEYTYSLKLLMVVGSSQHINMLNSEILSQLLAICGNVSTNCETLDDWNEFSPLKN